MNLKTIQSVNRFDSKFFLYFRYFEIISNFKGSQNYSITTKLFPVAIPNH